VTIAERRFAALPITGRSGRRTATTRSISAGMCAGASAGRGSIRLT